MLITGAILHAPMQATVSIVNNLSRVVSPAFIPNSDSSANNMLLEFLTWHAVPRQTRITYLPSGSPAEINHMTAYWF